MAYEGDDLGRSSMGRSAYETNAMWHGQQDVLRRAGSEVHNVSDRQRCLFCIVGFAVPSIAAWLYIVLFAPHTGLGIALLLMTLAGVCGALLVFFQQSYKRSQVAKRRNAVHR